MRHARVFVTAHGDEERYREALDGLDCPPRAASAPGSARRVQHEVPARARFHVDTSVDEGMRIAEAIRAEREAGRVPDDRTRTTGRSRWPSPSRRTTRRPALLAGASSVVVCAHVDPDGDAIGSTLGLTLALRRLGIDAAPVLAEDRGAPRHVRVPAGLRTSCGPRRELERRRPCSSRSTRPTRRGSATPRGSRAGGARRARHRPPSRQHRASATSTSSTRRRPPSGRSCGACCRCSASTPDADIAMCLYVALLTDTGRFQYSNSDARVLRDAADMVDAGVDVHARLRAHLREPDARPPRDRRPREVARRARQRRPRRVLVGDGRRTSPRRAPRTRRPRTSSTRSASSAASTSCSSRRSRTAPAG